MSTSAFVVLLEEARSYEEMCWRPVFLVVFLLWVSDGWSVNALSLQLPSTNTTLAAITTTNTTITTTNIMALRKPYKFIGIPHVMCGIPMK